MGYYTTALNNIGLKISGIKSLEISGREEMSSPFEEVKKEIWHLDRLLFDSCRMAWPTSCTFHSILSKSCVYIKNSTCDDEKKHWNWNGMPPVIMHNPVEPCAVWSSELQPWDKNCHDLIGPMTRSCKPHSSSQGEPKLLWRGISSINYSCCCSSIRRIKLEKISHHLKHHRALQNLIQGPHDQ